MRPFNGIATVRLLESVTVAIVHAHPDGRVVVTLRHMPPQLVPDDIPPPAAAFRTDGPGQPLWTNPTILTIPDPDDGDRGPQISVIGREQLPQWPIPPWTNPPWTIPLWATTWIVSDPPGPPSLRLLLLTDSEPNPMPIGIDRTVLVHRAVGSGLAYGLVRTVHGTPPDTRPTGEL